DFRDALSIVEIRERVKEIARGLLLHCFANLSHVIRSLLASVFIAVLALLACVLSARGQTITTKVLDAGSGGDTGQYTSQAIVNGNPAIGYYNVTNGDLMFARDIAVDGSSAGTPVTLDSTGHVG